MLAISVNTDIAKAFAQLKTVTEAQQFRFAVAKALTTTAKQVQTEVKARMPERFTIRRNWVVLQLKMKAADKRGLEAIVYHNAPFMSMQETGGNKLAKRRYIAIPTSAVKRTKSQVVAKSDRPQALMAKAKTAIIEYKGNKWIALQKREKGRGEGHKLRLLYLLIPQAHINKRLGLETDGVRILRANLAKNLQDAIDYAVRTAK